MAGTKRVEVTSSEIVGRIHAPNPISDTGLVTIETMIEHGLVPKGLLSAEDGEKILKILKFNPSRQLANLGKKISRLERMVEELTSMNQSLSHLTDLMNESLEETGKVLDWNPNWNKTEEDEKY